MDLRCAIWQAEELFGAMRLLGKTVELIRFPEESHDLSRAGRPDRRVERLRRLAGWYERFLGTAATDRATEEGATQVLPVPDFATRELPSEQPAAEAFDDGIFHQMVAEPEAVPAPSVLETETLVLPTLEPTEPSTQIEAIQPDLAEPEALPDLPEPELAGVAEAEPEPVIETEPQPEPEPLVAIESEPELEAEAEAEPLGAAEPEPEPEAEAAAGPAPPPQAAVASRPRAPPAVPAPRQPGPPPHPSPPPPPPPPSPTSPL